MATKMNAETAKRVKALNINAKNEEEAREFGNWFLDNSKCHVVVYMWVSSTVDYNDDSNRDISMSRWSIDGDRF